MNNSKSLPVSGFVDVAFLLGEIPISRSSLYAAIAAGRIPPLVAIGPRRKAMRVDDFRALLAAWRNHREWSAEIDNQPALTLFQGGRAIEFPAELAIEFSDLLTGVSVPPPAALAFFAAARAILPRDQGAA